MVHAGIYLCNSHLASTIEPPEVTYLFKCKKTGFLSAMTLQRVSHIKNHTILSNKSEDRLCPSFWILPKVRPMVSGNRQFLFSLIHLLCVVFFFATGHNISQASDPNSPFLFRPPGFGYNLPVVYLVWFCVVMVLYRPCKRYSEYKLTHRKWWLSYVWGRMEVIQQVNRSISEKVNKWIGQ